MKLILALAAAALVGGCASVPMQQRAQNDSLMACDYARMQTIDRVAAQRGVYVEWVHCPMLKRDHT